MLIWNVKLWDRVLVSVTDKVTAEGLVALLNNGTLHGVPGEAVAYEAARAPRTPADTVAEVEVQAPPNALVEAMLTARVADAKAMIAAQDDVAVLDMLHAAERAHPKYEAGRSKVLDAIEERRGELAVSDPHETAEWGSLD